MIEFFTHEGIDYKIEFDAVCLSQSLKIDCDSFDGLEFLSLKEMQAIIKYVDFKIYRDEQLCFDSKKQNVANLHFNFTKKIYTILRSHLTLNPNEIKKFLTECNHFLKEKKPIFGLPEELFIAQNIYHGNIQLSLCDMMSMETKKYEKIQLALDILSNAVDDNQNQN